MMSVKHVLLSLSLSLTVFSTSVLASESTFIYVSPTGSDNLGDGSITSPYSTLSRAQLAARLVTQTDKTGDVVIALHSGEYFQSKTLEFTQSDSGTSANARVIYRGGWPNNDSQTDSTTTIHAGVALNNWLIHDAVLGVWVTQLPSNILDTRQVWNASSSGTALMRGSIAAGLGSGAAITDTGYTANLKNVPWLVDPSQQASQVEFLYTGVGSSWTECRLRVSSYTIIGNVVNITMAEPAWSFHKRAYGQALTFPVSAANLYTTLNDGEWSIDATIGSIFVKSGISPPSPNSLFIPALDILAKFTMTQWLSFENITFSYAGWLEPNSGLGYVDMQSGYRIVDAASDPSNDDLWVPVPGNIQIHDSRNITFTYCNFISFGATALAVMDSSQSVAIFNSTFSEIACSGVALGQVSDVNVTAASENGYFTLDSSLFTSTPNMYHDCAPILGGYIVSSNITHNAIINASNGGICIGWGWSRDEAVNSGWNAITFNYVYRSNYLLEDCGSIYVLGPQPSSIMAENFLSNQVKLFGALYTDEGSAYWHITRNVVHNVPEWLHIWTPSIHDELVDWNWSDQTYQDVHGTNITLRNNTFIVPGDAFPPEAMAVMAASGPAWWTEPRV